MGAAIEFDSFVRSIGLCNIQNQIESDMNAVTANLDVLMNQIRQEVERHRIREGATNSDGTADCLKTNTETTLSDRVLSEEIPAPIRIHLNLEFPASKLNRGAEITSCKPCYSELIRYDDDEFLRAAYWCVFGREPDTDGMSCYRAMLEEGASKAEILGRLRSSPEGKECGAKIKGLTVPYALDAMSRKPAIGSVVRFLTALCNLSARERSDRRDRAVLRRRIASIDSRVGITGTVSHEALRHLEQLINGANERVSAVDRATRSLRNSLQALQRQVADKADSTSVVARFNELSAGLYSLADHETLASLVRELEAALQRKADGESIEALKIAMDASVDAHIGTVREQIGSLRAEAADIQGWLADEIAAIQRRLQVLFEGKADRADLKALSTVVAGAADTAEKLGQQAIDEITRSRARDIDHLAERLTFETQQIRSAIASELSSEVARLEKFVHLLDAAKVDWVSIEPLRRETAAAHSSTEQLRLSYLAQERRLELLLEETRKRLAE